MKPLKTQIKKRSGVVLVEALCASGLALIITISAAWLVFNVWAKSYLHTEAFYITRASLYGNLHSCRPANHLVSQHFIKRQALCTNNSTGMSYQPLPALSPKKFNLYVQLIP